MTQHDDALRLEHMLKYAQEAVEMAQSRCRNDLNTDRLFRHAMTRLVEVVGEAAAQISEKGAETFPQIPLRQARDMRNRLIHGYDIVDLDILWDTIQVDLPALIVELRRVLGEKQ